MKPTNLQFLLLLESQQKSGDSDSISLYLDVYNHMINDAELRHTHSTKLLRKLKAMHDTFISASALTESTQTDSDNVSNDEVLQLLALVTKNEDKQLEVLPAVMESLANPDINKTDIEKNHNLKRTTLYRTMDALSPILKTYCLYFREQTPSKGVMLKKRLLAETRTLALEEFFTQNELLSSWLKDLQN